MKIPPWKGDYHHDLNTELCYWPAYNGIVGGYLFVGVGILVYSLATKVQKLSAPEEQLET